MRFLCESHQNCPWICEVLKNASGSWGGDFTVKEISIKNKSVTVESILVGTKKAQKESFSTHFQKKKFRPLSEAIVSKDFLISSQ